MTEGSTPFRLTKSRNTITYILVNMKQHHCLPYIGIARMHELGIPDEKISYVINKAIEARKAGLPESEVEEVIKKARFEVQYGH